MPFIIKINSFLFLISLANKIIVAHAKPHVDTIIFSRFRAPGRILHIFHSATLPFEL